MPVPVINTTTSVLGCYQYQYFEYQPFATNSPTSWAMGSAPLPFGASLDTTSGLLTFAVIFPGVYNFSLIATNGDGASAEQMFTVGVEASTQQLSSAISMTIELSTRTASITALNVKRGDDVTFLITFTQGGVTVDLNLANLLFNVAGNQTAFDLCLGAQQWVKTGVLSQALYTLHVLFDSAQIDAFFFNEQNPQMLLAALGEFEWIETVTSPLSGWPATLRGSSFNFPVNLAVDLSTEPTEPAV